MKYKKLFTPVKVGSITLKNRFAMAPMGPLGLGDAKGGWNQRGIDYYTERAKGGTGLIITGVTFSDGEVEAQDPAIIPNSTYHPVHFVRTSKEMTERIHAYGSKIFLQMSGGVLQYFDLEKIKPEMFNEYHANTVGGYLANQNLLMKYVAMNNEMLDKLEEWGVNVPKKRIPTGPMTYMIGLDLDITIKMRQKAAKLGVRFLDKTTISDLLTCDGKIAGAVGYSIIDGTFYVFEGKKVILCTGSQNYRVASMWSNGRGDGFHAAYRAGAQMRNPEFGNFAQLFRVNSNRECVFCENVMYDNYGENITNSKKQLTHLCSVKRESIRKNSSTRYRTSCAR